jgi:hemerythrin superfamily protein
MNGLELLKADHRHVNDLFDLVERETALNKRRDIFNEITVELNLHMSIEEKVLYPYFAEKEGFREEIEHSYDEHQEAKSVLLEIQATHHENRFDNLIGELVKAVRHHIKTEENEIFPKMTGILTFEELEILGQKLQEEKQKPPEETLAA